MESSTSVSQLHRVGTALAKRLKHLGIHTAGDLLMYFPFRYEDYSHIAPIRELQDGVQVTVKGKIELIATKRSPRKRMLITEAVVADDSGQVRVVWFGQPFIGKTLKVGDDIFLSGKTKSDMFGVQLMSPSYERVKKETTHTARIIPIYPLTAGMTQKQLRSLINQVLPLAEIVPEWLPEEVRDRADVMPLGEALHLIHFPETLDDVRHAERRLKFDELFVLQLRAEMIRQTLKRATAPTLTFHEAEVKEFVAKLPFQLTADQKVAAWEIIKDIGKSEPMNRLLEGDVGSGKTVVAALTMFNAVLNGYQSVIMAPTEILATQHYESLRKVFDTSGIEVSLITRTKRGLASANIIVGTHALLTDKIAFQKLGLVIVDEQHRFGVEQRKMIREKSGMKDMVPHFLSMTATPIPRSFALTLYGDLDLSIIKQMPAGRKPIKTRLVAPHQREKAYGFIREQVNVGRQCFVICPLIEVNDESRIMNHGTKKKDQDMIHNSQFMIQNEKKTVLDEYEKLSKKIFPDLQVGFLHGKLKTKEKDETMGKFAKGEIDILVSTSVVEVGVNIPNASVMMIEGADKFGLAQLHQFRGRVGRSDHQSYCFLFTDSDSVVAHDRLAFFEKTLDGFALAEYDLQTRGPGDVYGTSQSGSMQLRLATMRDTELIKLARDLARGVDFEKHPSLKEKVQEWEGKVHLE